MRILIVSATAAETDSLRAVARARRGDEIELLITGVGMVATGVHTARALLQSRYDLALNLGVCGAFDPALRPGAVVHIVSDALPELGAEDGTSFLTVRELGLMTANDPPFSDGWLVNAAPPDNAALKTLRAVRGITVNTVHGDDRSIAAVVERCQPQVESMEGAAFMYACLVHGIPFAQVRAVSNVVERRNRAAWKITDAIAALERAATDILEHV